MHAIGKDSIKISEEETMRTKKTTKKKMYLKNRARNDFQTPNEKTAYVVLCWGSSLKCICM